MLIDHVVCPRCKKSHEWRVTDANHKWSRFNVACCGCEHRMTEDKWLVYEQVCAIEAQKNDS